MKLFLVFSVILFSVIMFGYSLHTHDFTYYFDESVFRNYKGLIEDDSFYIYSLFRYEDVIKIIRIKESEDI